MADLPSEYEERGFEIARLRAGLGQIASGDYNDLAGDPSKWASTIAYCALGGLVREGVRVDYVGDLV